MTRWAALPIVAGLLASCGGSGGDRPAGEPAAGAPPALEACRLFTAEDASAILGAPATSPEGWRRLDAANPSTGITLSNCMYAAEGTQRTAHVVVTHSARDPYPGSLEELKQAVAQGPQASLAGLSAELLEASQPMTVGGQPAYWTPDLGTLTVLARRHYLVTAGVDPATAGDAAGARAGAERLAALIVERLPAQ